MTRDGAHTPGPWRVWAEPSALFIEATVTINETNVPGTRTVAKIARHDRAEADALMIAEAPAMLAALRDLRELALRHAPNLREYAAVTDADAILARIGGGK